MKKFKITAELKAGNSTQLITTEFEVPKTATMETVNKEAVIRIQALLHGTPEPHAYKILKIDEIITHFEAK